MILGSELLLVHPAVPSRLRGIFARYRPVYTTLDVDSVAIAYGVPSLAHHLAGYNIGKYIRECVGLAANRAYLGAITRRVTKYPSLYPPYMVKAWVQG